MIRAKKRFGQNFLKDEAIKEKIIQAMLKDANVVAEIGPGLGDLTQKLLARCERVSAFEIDLELCGVLKHKFKDELALGRLMLECSDVLEVWRERTLLSESYHLVANLPYYIATNIILKALADSNCQSMLVMVQKEVAKKFASSSGDKEFSSLAIFASSIANVEVMFDVGAESFEPPPKVTSSVLRIVKHKEFVKSDKRDGIFGSSDELKRFESFLKVAFSAPRKTLYKNLQPILDRESILQIFDELELSLKIRPHQLKVETYHLLFKKLK